MRRACACAVLVVSLGLFAAANAGEISLRWTFDKADVHLGRTGQYTQVYLKDSALPSDKLGLPDIPSRYAFVIVPCGARPVGIRSDSAEELLADKMLMYPVQPGRSTNDPPLPFTQPNAAAYRPWAKFPGEAASIQGTITLHGCTIVVLRLNPVRWSPASRRLFVASEIRVSLAYEAPLTPPSVVCARTQRARDDVTSLVSNKGDVARFFPGGSGVGAQDGGDGTAVYLLITNEALKDAFQPLVDRRTAQGKTGKLVTVEWIDPNYDGTRPDGGSDLQTKIPNCIIDHYQNHSTVWVCLGGDDTVVPVRYCGDPPRWLDILCDLYYAGLDGTWDANGNGIYGEMGDHPDFASDVWVGRIPVRTADQVSGHLASSSTTSPGRRTDSQTACCCRATMARATVGSREQPARQDSRTMTRWIRTRSSRATSIGRTPGGYRTSSKRSPPTSSSRHSLRGTAPLAGTMSRPRRTSWRSSTTATTSCSTSRTGTRPSTTGSGLTSRRR